VTKKTSIIPAVRIDETILWIRDERVILDQDLAVLYGVQTKAITQAVRRNVDRFPADFMFQLSGDEWKVLRSRIVTSKGRGGRRYRPYAFTEQGVAMLSSVLKSKRAIEVNVEIMRAFVKLRRILASHAALDRKLRELEKKYDASFKAVFDAIRQLSLPVPPKKGRPIGFKTEEKKKA